MMAVIVETSSIIMSELNVFAVNELYCFYVIVRKLSRRHEGMSLLKVLSGELSTLAWSLRSLPGNS
jgi:hypothetical protein